MGTTRAVAILILVSFCALSLGSWAGRPRKRHFFSTLGGSLFPGLLEIDEDMVEQLWIHCRQDLMQIKEKMKFYGVLLPQEISIEYAELSPEVRSEAKFNLQKTINSVSPAMRSTLVGCVKKSNSITLHASDVEGDDAQNWFAKCLEMLSLWGSSRRRNLADQMAAYPPSSSPFPAPIADPPAGTPEPSQSILSLGSPGQSPSVDPEYPMFPPDPPNVPSTFLPSPDLAPPSGPSQTGSEGTDKRVVAVAVIVTAIGTSLFTACLFCCYSKFNRKSSGFSDTSKDDRPLLALSFSDFSVGSSHKSNGLGQSVENDKLETLTFKCNQTINRRGSSLEMNSISSEINIVKSSLPLPPAAVAAAIQAAKFSKDPHPSKDGLVNSDVPAPSIPPATDTSPAPPAPPPVPPKKAPHAPAPPPPPPSVKLPPTPSMKASSAHGAGPASGGPPSPPPVSSTMKVGPRPPPPPPSKAGSALPRPSSGAKATQTSLHAGSSNDSDGSKPKLKPFFWDKVLANPDHSMVWHQIKSGSFQFNEEMIETLFGYNNLPEKTKIERRKKAPSIDTANQFVQILDHKKSQNLSILLRALNVTVDEVCDALMDGNELPVELLETFLKMSPTSDEELRLRLYCGEISQLLPAERFLKALVDIPFSFKRMDALLYMTRFQEEASSVKESFSILEVACQELRSSRLFLKLLEAVLKTGNRMNVGTYRGGAQAFKLDTLLKLSDVKGTDGKTTLLHFVVQEIIRSEGVRRARVLNESNSMSSVHSVELTEEPLHEGNSDYRNLGLQVVSGLSQELENVKKAAIIDADILTGVVSNLSHGIVNLKEFLNRDMRSLQEKSGFQGSLESFVSHSEGEVTWLLEEERRIRALVKATTDYFHGSASKDEGLRLFVIVRDFLVMLDKVCIEVKASVRKVPKTPRNTEPSAVPHVTDHRQLLFPAIKDLRKGPSSSSSDDDD